MSNILHLSNDVTLSKDNVELDTDQVNELIKAQINSYYKVLQCTVDKTDHTMSTAISASVPSGYKFLAWVNVASKGNVVLAYIEDSLASSTTIWQLDRDQVGFSFIGTYIVVNDS